MRVCFIITISVLCLSCVQSVSLGFDRELQKKNLPKRLWELPSDQAAMTISKVFSENKGLMKIEKKVTPVPSGYVTYGGVSNANGQSNQLIQFSDAGVIEYRIDVDNGYRGFFNERYEKNAMTFKCEKLKLGKKTQKACAIIQHFNGMKLITEGFAITRDSIDSNPPTTYNEVNIFDKKGKFLGDKKKDIRILELDWRSDYAEAILRKSKPAAKAFKKFSEDGKERALSIILLRGILNDKFAPDSFLKSIVEGVNHTCMVELHDDLIKLSKRVPPVSPYVKRFRLLDKKFEGRSIELELDMNRKKSKDELKRDALRNRFFEDDEQLLRAEIDTAIETLEAVGKENEIKRLMNEGHFVDHLVYEMYFRDRTAFTRLKLNQLSIAESGYDHYAVIREIRKSGGENALLDYLEKADKKKFSQCSPEVAELVRKKRPAWKKRLQEGMIRYVKENQDRGRWTFSALNKLMPEDDPHYFDLEAVGKCLFDKKVQEKIMRQRFMDGEKDYAELVATWRKLKAKK